jgi:catechol 2,3-dioxygenase-like lactoylglutathione lyase family enzyme
MPQLTGVLETSLYVEDLERSIRFYQEVMQFRKLVGDERFGALQAARQQVLLLFKMGASTEPMVIDGGTIPPHDGSGQTHLAFAISVEELEPWERWLQQHQVVIESKVRWERGGQSIYFRDLDGHLLELVTPGCWSIY